ncbi:hypothetical protein H0H92_012055, partial [Tricholoma furcatifolium]
QDIIPSTPVSLPDTRQQNPHQRFVGRYIKVLKGPFKDYLGFVKNTEQGDLLNVELQATLQRQQFDLRDIAHANDPQLRPLIDYAKTIGPLPNFPSIQRVDEPAQLSSMPLVPSTPIPEDSSAAMGRAWNPSSHTPNPNSSYPCNPYMDSIRMDEGMRVHVVITGTRPVLRDPGWKAGDLEGTRGLWKKSDNEEPGFAYVRIGLNVVERVPERYIMTTPPSMKGQRAIVINPSDTERFCREFYVIQYDVSTKDCVVRPANTINRKIRITIPASSLAIIS